MNHRLHFCTLLAGLALAGSGCFVTARGGYDLATAEKSTISGSPTYEVVAGFDSTFFNMVRVGYGVGTPMHRLKKDGVANTYLTSASTISPEVSLALLTNYGAPNNEACDLEKGWQVRATGFVHSAGTSDLPLFKSVRPSGAVQVDKDYKPVAGWDAVNGVNGSKVTSYTAFGGSLDIGGFNYHGRNAQKTNWGGGAAFIGVGAKVASLTSVFGDKPGAGTYESVKILSPTVHVTFQWYPGSIGAWFTPESAMRGVEKVVVLEHWMCEEAFAGDTEQIAKCNERKARAMTEARKQRAIEAAENKCY